MSVASSMGKVFVADPVNYVKFKRVALGIRNYFGLSCS